MNPRVVLRIDSSKTESKRLEQAERRDHTMRTIAGRAMQTAREKGR